MDLQRLDRSRLESPNLASDAFMAVLRHLKEREGSERETMAKRLPRQWRAVYTVCGLDGEINNGGHHQFFWNSDGAWNAETLDDLTYIGAGPFVPIFLAALIIYASESFAEEKESSGNSAEAFLEGYEDDPFAECDKAFYAENKSLYEYVADFIRSNPDLFCKP